MTLWFLLLFVGETVLMMALAVPLMRGLIKPNGIYGIRTPRTLSDEGIWYRSNAYGGRLLFYTGLVQLVILVALYAVPRLRDDFVAYNLTCAAVVLIGLLVVVVRTLRFVRSL